MTKKPIGAVLKGHRERLGLPLRDASEKTGVDHSFISRIETGASIPTLTILEMLAEGYGLRLQQILEESGIR